jgi:hypothetical protein
VKSLPFILRDHREELWRRWADALVDRVGADYHELVASPLGERILRNLLDELIALSEAEEYEVAGLLKRVAERATMETGHRLELGFAVLDMVVALQVLRGAMLDTLLDALVLDEMPSFGDTLGQLKVVDAYLDRLVCATVVAG